MQQPSNAMHVAVHKAMLMPNVKEQEGK